MIPSFKSQIGLEKGSRLLSLMMVIQHPDGQIVFVHPQQIYDLQVDTQTDMDLNDGQNITYTQTGHLSCSFKQVVVKRAGGHLPLVDPGLQHDQKVEPEPPGPKNPCPKCGLDSYIHCHDPECGRFLVHPSFVVGDDELPHLVVTQSAAEATISIEFDAGPPDSAPAEDTDPQP